MSDDSEKGFLLQKTVPLAYQTNFEKGHPGHSYHMDLWVQVEH